MADPYAIVDLTEARSFLNFDDDDTTDDDELQSFIDALTPVVERETGPVVAREVTDLIYPTGTGSFDLPRWPVVSFTSGETLNDATVVDVSGLVADKGRAFNADGSGLPLEMWSLTYVVGRSEVPESIKKGALEILRLAWATQRSEELPAFLIPYRAAAWLNPTPGLPGFA